MPEQTMTAEFSICLLPDDDTRQRVDALRAVLPTSPYRDDRPHITLLRGISSAQLVSDEQLIADLEQVLDLSHQLPLAATCKQIANKSNQFYSASGLILLQPSTELINFRRSVAEKLVAHNYSVEQQELDSYEPHVSIRLGVPLTGELLTRTQADFDSKVISFAKWMVLRLVKDGEARQMHEVLA